MAITNVRVNDIANQEHVDILKQGVKEWNQWRKEHPEIQPDLGDVSVVGANLTGADLRGADLSYALQWHF